MNCKNNYDPDNQDNNQDETIVVSNYKLPRGSLSQDAQKKPLDPNNKSITLFKKGDFGSKYYRIPSLLVTKKGTLIAAIDRRYDSPADLGVNKTRVDVLIRRSEDLGNSWSSPILIGDGAGNNPQDRSKSYGDVFMVNGHDGSIILGLIKEPGRQQKTPRGNTIIYRSIDDGKSWNKVSEISPSMIPNADRGFGVSGQGVTLRHGINKNNNKIMFTYFQWDKNGGGGVSISTMISYDNGITWNAVGNLKPSSSIDETKGVELSDGTIMLNHRRSVNEGGRSWSISKDGGKTWTYQGIDPEVDDPGNNAEMVRYEFNGKHIKDNKYILMINANSKKNGKWFFARKNHYVRLTKNEFNNGNGTSYGKYAYSKQLVKNGDKLYSGYPVITVLPDGTIATLTEETWTTSRNPTPTDAGGDDYDIVFRRFNLFWLTDGKEYVDYSKDFLFQNSN